MDRRACLYVRIAWLVLAAGLLCISARYVAQSRYVNVGFCPPQVLGVPSLLVYDTFGVRTLCVPLPPILDKSEIAPRVPSSDSKTGV